MANMLKHEDMDETQEVDDFLNDALDDALSDEDSSVNDAVREIDIALEEAGSSSVDYRSSGVSAETYSSSDVRMSSTSGEGGDDESDLEIVKEDIIDDLFDEDALNEDEISPELRRILAPNKTIFSIDGYRRRTMSVANLAPAVDYRRSTSLSMCSYDSESSSELSGDCPAYNDYRKRIKELQASLQQEQAVIAQASNALNQCSLTDPNNASVIAQVECNKLLLIANLRHKAIMEQIEKLRSSTLSTDSHNDTGIGCLTISDIQMPLTREFIDVIGTEEDTTEHFFILVLRNGAQVYTTQLVSSHRDEALRCGTLTFPNTIKLHDVQNDFKFDLDVYSLQVNRDTKKKSGKGFKKSNSFVKDFIYNVFGTSSSETGRRKSFPGSSNSEIIKATNFTHVSSLPITPESLEQINFFMQSVPHQSPLQGTVHMTLNSNLETNIMYSGFMNLTDDFSGFGACRYRRWCVLEKDRLCFWQYPEDEADKEPLGEINLKECITPEIKLAPRDRCVKPNTIELTTVTTSLKPGTMTMSRKLREKNQLQYWISFDSSSDRLDWCKKLNEALMNIRRWSTDAVKPVHAIHRIC